MSVSTVTMPRPSSRTRAPDFISRLLRKAAATPMPISQWPSRVWPGSDVRASPAEAFGADAQALDELPLRERSLRIFRIDLRVVEDRGTRSDRCSSFSAISSMAISSAIMPGASPGARMALPSGRSSTASRMRRHPVRAGVEQPRLLDRSLGLAVRADCRTSFRGRSR